MGLRAAFDLLLSGRDPLSGIDSLIWQNLSAGSRSPKHPWNLAVLSTIDSISQADHVPDARTVVLRSVDREGLILDCHTDPRSEKVRQIQDGSPVHWVFYRDATKIQLRVAATAKVLTEGAVVDEAWSRTTFRSRSAYLTSSPPGSEHAGPQPPDTSDRHVDQAQSEKGRETFAIVRTLVRQIDWLYLRRDGHVRARLDYNEVGQLTQATWLNP